MSKWKELITTQEIDLLSVVTPNERLVIVPQPAFLDQAGEARSVKTVEHTLTDFKTVCENHAIVYLYKVMQKSNQSADAYVFRYVALGERPSLHVSEDVKTTKRYINDAGITAVGVELKVRLDYGDVLAMWGKDEIAKNLGLRILEEVEKSRSQCG